MKLAPTPITRDFISLREALDRIVEEGMVWPLGLFEGPSTTFAVDLSETADAYVLRASLPGMKPDDIDITATTNSISIAGEHTSETTVKDATYLRQERQAGVFKRSFAKRSFALPLPIDPDKIDAVQTDGVLTVAMPKAEVTKHARVQVKAKG
ncbi:MAG: Hsp20/alpha crystallin family protein [Chloroflexota bacterium]|nr:Hsp20/alpha crystallin family protein [Chloroflexota bacterium]